MQITHEKPGQMALTTDASAAALGLDEFSLFSRIQTGEINAVRVRSGQMMVPESELERLTGGHVTAPPPCESGSIQPDKCLGIERPLTGLKRNGELSSPYKVSNCRFSGDEIQAYRAASSAIAEQLNHAKDFKPATE